MFRATPTSLVFRLVLGVLLLTHTAVAQDSPQAIENATPPVAERVEAAQAAAKDADEPALGLANPAPSASTADAQPPTDEPAPTPGSPDLPSEIVLRDWLVLPRVGDYTRSIVALDPVDAQLASGEWRTPNQGDEVTGADGRTYRWSGNGGPEPAIVRSSEASGGYAVATVESTSQRVMILHAERHASACVNGEWFTGDPYGHGWVRLPVLLREGRNEFLFHMAAPGFQARLTAPGGKAYLLVEDATLPDVVREEEGETWGAAPVVNATNETLVGAKLRLRTESGATAVTALPSIAPLCVYKAAFRFTPDRTDADASTLFVELLLPSADGDSSSEEVAAEARLELRQVSEDKPQTRTFVSSIDGSVQPYTLVPAVSLSSSPAEPPGIILALHNKGVNHDRHASYYQAKDWAHIVAPQNRRAVGFEWEDWGAADALEALADAQSHMPHDPSRTCLTGHSMGGHGAWRLGVTHPDRFAAVAPSAGWVSLWTYGGKMPTYESPTRIQEVLSRATAPCDTAKYLRNLSGVGVYVLHGDQDDDVRISQSRFMRRRLGEFHTDFAYFERQGAGNWWGNDTCDWPSMMEYLRERRTPAPADVSNIDFTTPDPSLWSQRHWATIEGQEVQGELSRIRLTLDSDRSLVRGATENVERMSLDLGFLPEDKPVRLQIDGNRTLTVASRGDAGKVWIEKSSRGRWRVGSANPREKSPRRGGRFKSAFDNNAVLVYSTGGDTEENAWSLAKARYDAQTFWYRGNGSLEVIADKDFDPDSQRNRNVVLYGNTDTNLALPALLSTCPVRVRGGKVLVRSEGIERAEEGENLATLFVRPRFGSQTATVGMVGGAGLPGMRLTNRIRYFLAGVNLPDLTIIGADAAASGDEDIRAVGYFGGDWRIETGDIEWRDLAL